MNELDVMRRLSLTPQLMRGLLCFLPTGGATNQTLHKAIAYGPNADPGVVPVAVLKIRRKLDPHGIEILTRRNVGYELAPGSLEKLKAVLNRDNHNVVAGA